MLPKRAGSTRGDLTTVSAPGSRFEFANGLSLQLGQWTIWKRLGIRLSTSLKTAMAETMIAIKLIEFLETRDGNEKLRLTGEVMTAHWLCACWHQYIVTHCMYCLCNLCPEKGPFPDVCYIDDQLNFYQMVSTSWSIKAHSCDLTVQCSAHVFKRAGCHLKRAL